MGKEEESEEGMEQEGREEENCNEDEEIWFDDENCLRDEIWFDDENWLGEETCFGETCFKEYSL